MAQASTRETKQTTPRRVFARTTQTKATDLLREMAESEGYELVVDTTIAVNVGRFLFQAPDSFRTVLVMGFDFQGDRATFSFGGDSWPPFAYEVGAWHRVSVAPEQGERWADLFAWLRVELREA